jgi:hypothetical protein
MSEVPQCSKCGQEIQNEIQDEISLGVMDIQREPGRPGCEVRQAWCLRFGLSGKRGRLSLRFLEQLSLCRSDAARRLILGISR